MNLGISTEQRELRESVRRFLTERAPLTKVRELMETADRTDPDVWRQASAQLGLPGIAIPEEYGGAGFSFAEQAIVLEEFGAALFTGPYLASAVLAATALLASDDEEAKKDLLPGIAAGETVATLAFTEDGGSWDPASIRLAAAKTTENGWRLDGHKSFVLDGHAADLILAVAATETDGKLSLFAVTSTANGLTRRALPTLDQTRKLARLAFNHTPARLVGEPGTARAVLDHTLDVAAVALAAEQLGGAQRALDMAVAYAKVRQQFGRPIGSFRPSSTGAPTCCSRWNRCARPSATPRHRRRGLGRSPGAGLAAQSVCLRGVLARRGREHPDPRRHRLHLGARRAPVPQAGQSQRAVPRRRQLPPRTPGHPHRPVTSHRGTGTPNSPSSSCE